MMMTSHYFTRCHKLAPLTTIEAPPKKDQLSAFHFPVCQAVEYVSEVCRWTGKMKLPTGSMTPHGRVFRIMLTKCELERCWKMGCGRVRVVAANLLFLYYSEDLAMRAELGRMENAGTTCRQVVYGEPCLPWKLSEIFT